MDDKDREIAKLTELCQLLLQQNTQLAEEIDAIYNRPTRPEVYTVAEALKKNFPLNAVRGRLHVNEAQDKRFELLKQLLNPPKGFDPNA